MITEGTGVSRWCRSRRAIFHFLLWLCILAAFMEEGMVFSCKKEKTDSSCFLFHISHYNHSLFLLMGGTVCVHMDMLWFSLSSSKRIYIYSWRLLPVRKKGKYPKRQSNGTLFFFIEFVLACEGTL